MPANKTLKKFQERINYYFKEENHLIEALTHPSYSSEKQMATRDNQRLEFLGDAVIQIIITKKLYHLFTDLPEGDLTKIRAALSRESTLAKFAKNIELGKFLLMGHGEVINKGYDRDSILCDAFEAIIGAIYIDCDNNVKIVEAFLNNLIESNFTQENLISFVKTENPKGTLQEWSQKYLSETPLYKILEAEGPDHEKTFTVGAYISENCYGVGTGAKRQVAEENAARCALEKMQSKKLNNRN